MKVLHISLYSRCFEYTKEEWIVERSAQVCITILQTCKVWGCVRNHLTWGEKVLVEGVASKVIKLQRCLELCWARILGTRCLWRRLVRGSKGVWNGSFLTTWRDACERVQSRLLVRLQVSCLVELQRLTHQRTWWDRREDSPVRNLLENLFVSFIFSFYACACAFHSIPLFADLLNSFMIDLNAIWS